MNRSGLFKFRMLPGWCVPVGHILVLLAILYYSIILAAVVYNDDIWETSTIRAVPVFIALSFVWLNFYRFKVLRLTFISMTVFAWFVMQGTYYVFVNSAPGALAHIPYILGNYPIAKTSRIFTNYNITRMFLWLPYTLFWIFLYVGLVKRCPRCNLVDGVFARRILREDYQGSYTRTIKENVNRSGVVKSGPLAGAQFDVSVPEWVNYTTQNYLVSCECKACGYRWSFTKSRTTRG